ncbi:anti-anti-sigma factor [Lentzea xinjiangensis]|uniref:Anti-sigma factor antagonist n=1 Tax=Lentzea xinjiangensis TaxID=402600 RepID=A0A1H9QIF6_9PSEU|nr:STAS domain-containing protein [Lentzea xinjiangensis]SER60197.1 anti-anti-sigma factor [Lentzea xinjiangensis]
MNQIRQRTTYIQSIPIVALTGEIDVMSSAPITSTLFELLGSKPPALVVDLREVRFFGSEGIRALVQTQNQADQLGVKFGVVSDTRTVLRPLEMTAVDRLLLLFADVDDAVTALRR